MQAVGRWSLAQKLGLDVAPGVLARPDGRDARLSINLEKRRLSPILDSL
jgi:hypothetical protein